MVPHAWPSRARACWLEAGVEAGVTLELTLPLAFTPQASFSPQQLAEWMRGNVSLLQALASLESSRERDGDSAGDPALARLEAKVDLALQLISELLRREARLPDPTAVSLSSSGLCWHGSAPLHATGVVALYLAPRLPWPLMLPVQITGVAGERVHARLLHLDEDSQTWLDRTLFRHHRRSVQARGRTA